MAAEVAAAAGEPLSWFGKTAAFYRAISAIDPDAVSVEHLLAAGSKTGEAYDFIFSPGGMVSNTLVGDLKTNMKGVSDYAAATEGRHKFFQEQCRAEVAAKTLAKVRGTKASGTVSGLWFLRHLLFVTRFIELLFERADVAPSDAARRTYDEVLKPYHGFLLGGIVSAAMALAPSRDAFQANMGQPWAVLNVEAALFLQESKPVVARLKAFYDKEGWYFPDKA